jgi:hypothetical protein
LDTRAVSASVPRSVEDRTVIQLARPSLWFELAFASMISTMRSLWRERERERERVS